MWNYKKELTENRIYKPFLVMLYDVNKKDSYTTFVSNAKGVLWDQKHMSETPQAKT